MGWSKKQIWDLEHGRKTVTVAHFFMIARRLGIDPERLVRRVKKSKWRMMYCGEVKVAAEGRRCH